MNKMRYSLLMATLVLLSNQFSFSADVTSGDGTGKPDSAVVPPVKKSEEAEKKEAADADKKNTVDTLSLHATVDDSATNDDKSVKDKRHIEDETETKDKKDKAEATKKNKEKSSIAANLNNLWLKKGPLGKIGAGVLVSVPFVGIPVLINKIPAFIKEFNNRGYKLKNASVIALGTVTLSNIIYQIKYRIYDLGSKREIIKKIKDTLKDKNKFCNWRTDNAPSGWLGGKYGEKILDSAQNYKAKNEGELLIALKEDIELGKKRLSIGWGISLFDLVGTDNVNVKYKKTTLEAILNDLGSERDDLFKLKNDLLKHYKNLEPILLKVAENYRKDYEMYFKDAAEARTERLLSKKTNFIKMSLEGLEIFGDKHVNGKNDGLVNFSSLRKAYNVEIDKGESVKSHGIIDQLFNGLDKCKSIVGSFATAYNMVTLLDLEDDYKETYNEAISLYFDCAFAYARLNAIYRIVEDEWKQLAEKEAASGKKKDTDKIEVTMIKELDAIIQKADEIRKLGGDSLAAPNPTDASRISALTELFFNRYSTTYKNWSDTDKISLKAINEHARSVHSSIAMGGRDDDSGHVMGLGSSSKGSPLYAKIVNLHTQANILRDSLKDKIK